MSRDTTTEIRFYKPPALIYKYSLK